MNARGAARAEWVSTRAKELAASGFIPADAVSQAQREFDTADGVNFKTRGVVTGDLIRNARGELVDRKGRLVFDGALDDRRQLLDPDVADRDPQDEGDPNAVDGSTLQREVRVQTHGSHGSSGRRRHKKPPKPDAVEMARYDDVGRSLRSLGNETSAERFYREYHQAAREHRPGAPLKGSERRSRFVGRIEPTVVDELRDKTGLGAADLLRELHCLSLMAGDARTALFALDRIERLFVGGSVAEARETGT